MLKDILVCLEGSPSTEAATHVSLEMARACNARLAGLAIIDEPDIRAGAATGIGGSSFKHDRDESLLADAKKHADDWLALFEGRCLAASVPAISLEVVGRPADAILEEMDKHDLTVMGKDANFRFETETHDEKTRAVILHRATRPVLLVPESLTPTLGEVVLVAYDGSGAAKRALASFAKSGLAQSRQVHVATVDDNGVLAWEMAARGVEMLRIAGVTAKAHSIVSALANVDALFEMAEKMGAGLLVMGSSAGSRLRQWFDRSVTRELVEKAPIPLYLQH